MKILNVLIKEAVLVDLKSVDKKGVLEELTAPLTGITQTNRNDLVKILMDRERLGSTGIGGGIAIPHGKMRGLKTLILGFGLSRKGVNCESMDNRPSHIFFLLLTPENSTGVHLKLLARISKLLKDETVKERLFHASTPEEVLDIIQDHDEEF